MALNIKDPETERLAAEIAELTGETKTRAVNVALKQRLEGLRLARARRDRAEHLRRFLIDEVWPQVPPELLGVPITKAERAAMLGFDEVKP